MINTVNTTKNSPLICFLTTLQACFFYFSFRVNSHSFQTVSVFWPISFWFKELILTIPFLFSIYYSNILYTLFFLFFSTQLSHLVFFLLLMPNFLYLYFLFPFITSLLNTAISPVAVPASEINKFLRDIRHFQKYPDL